MRMSRRSRGSALVIVLAIAFLLAVQIYIIHAFSTSNFKHVNRVNAHIRAIYSCETVYSRMLARLKGAAWPDRWFSVRPAVEKNVPLTGGTYSSYIATVPDPERHLADVWVECKYEGAAVAMYWRVRYAEGTLDLYAQVQPDFFTFVPGNTPSPIAGAGPGPLTTVVEGMMEAQKRNRPRVRESLEEIRKRPSLPGVLETLGLTPRAPVRDESFPVAPAAPVPQPGYVDLIAAALPTGDPLAGIPGAPAGPPVPEADLLTKFPTPSNFPGVMDEIFKQRNLPPASTPTIEHFSDPTRALEMWQRAQDDRSVGKLDVMMRDMGQYLDFVASKYEGTGCSECFDVLATATDYLRAATVAEAARTGRAAPAAPSVDLRPYDNHAFRNALRVYGDWWFK